MIFGTRAYLTDVFRLEYQEQYQDVDLVLTYDNYSTSRIVNSRTIKEKYSEYFSFTATFFNIHSLIKINDKNAYVQVFSSSLAEFERVIQHDVDALNPKEMLITKSFAEQYDLVKGDVVYLELNNQEINYNVKEVLDDQGLFINNSVFVNKDELFETTVWSSSPNLGNIIYLNVKPDYSLLAVKELLYSDIQYADTLIYPAVDLDQVKVRVDFNTSVMLGIVVIIVLAMIMVVKSIFPLLFRDFSQQIGVIKILGGNNNFAFHIWGLQFVIYLLISIPLGIMFSLIIMNLGAHSFEIYTFLWIKPLPLILAIILLLGFLTLEIIMQYRRLTKKSVIFLSNNKQSEKQKSNLNLLIIMSALLLINLLFPPFPKQAALLTLILVISFSFIFISSIFKLLPRLIKKNNSFFSLFTVKYLRDSKIIHNSLKIIFISLVVFAVSLSVAKLFNTAGSKAMDEIKLDLIVTNIYDYQPSLIAQIEENYEVEQIAEGIVYRNITMDLPEESSRLIRLVFSIEPNQISHFFTYEMTEETLSKLADPNVLYIVLPYQYEKIKKVSIGDTVTLHLSQEIPSENFIVAGFYKNYSESAVFTNLHYSNKYINSPMANSVFIKSNNLLLQNNLIKQYSNKMYYVLDSESLFMNEIRKVMQVSDFFIAIIWVLIGCFVLVIINNSLLVYYSLKSDYAKIKIMGCRNHDLFVHVVYEVLVIMLVALVASFVNVVIVFNLFPSLLIMVGFYFQYDYELIDVLGYLFIGILVFICSYAYYFIKIKKMNVISETINL
jgi:hypothetical protein